MASLAFDTYKAVKSLQEAGFEEVQAEAVVAMVGGAMDEPVASKTDIADLRGSIRSELAGLRSEMHDKIASLRNKIAGLRNEMHSEIADLRADMYRRLWFMATGIVAVTVAGVKLIP